MLKKLQYIENSRPVGGCACLYTAYMAPSPDCTGPEGDKMSRAAGARPQDRSPAGHPPSSWSRVAGDPYGSEHGPAGPGSRAPRFRVSALAQCRQGAAAAGATAAPGGLERPRGSASGAPKTELSQDPESHCGRTQERVGSRTGAEAAQGRRSGPCPPQDLRMGSPLRVSPAGRGEVLGALPGAEAQLSQTSLAVWRPGGQRPPDINTRQITPRQVPLVWQTPD